MPKYTVEYCDERVEEYRTRLKEGTIDEQTAQAYIDLWLDYRLVVMEGGEIVEDPTLAGQSAR